MCAKRNLVGPSTKTKKMHINPHKIDKILKIKRSRKLKLNTEMKKRRKMKKGIQEEIIRSPTLLPLKTNVNSDRKYLKKGSQKNIQSFIKRRRLRLRTLLNEKLNAKAKNVLVELKPAGRKEENTCRFSQGNQQCDEMSSDEVISESQNGSVDKNIHEPTPSCENLNQSEEHSFAVNDSGSEEHDSSFHSDESYSLETGHLRNRSSQVFNACKSKGDDLSSRKMHETKAEFHHLSGKSYLLILRHPGQIYFRGTLSVTPISGVTSFLGYEFVPGMKSHLLFSPKGISPLYFSTTGHTCDVQETRKIPGLNEIILKRLGENDSSMLIEPAKGEHWDKLFGLFKNLLKFNPLDPPLKGVGNTKTGLNVENDLGVELVLPSSLSSSKSFHRESLEWENLSQEIHCFNRQKGQVRVMVFGGKGVGKSTFMRFLVNRWLTACNSNEKEQTSHKIGAILFIDFDPGQSEFVPPGCLSATLISEPLLGPNYTHLKDPERMICVGEIDVSTCPRWYLHCADDLVKFCSSEESLNKLPWFINTMGFCKGIGADLAVELIRLCNPTQVIQLTSIWSRRNFEPLDLLSWSSVNSWRGQEWNSELSYQNEADVPEYSYHQLQSLAERSEKDGLGRNKIAGIKDIDSQWGLPAWQSRELCVLAYFSRIVNAPKFSLLKPKPHMLKLSDVVLSLPSDLVDPKYITSVFNGRLAALCSLGVKTKGNISSEGNKACNSEEINQESVQHKKGSKKSWEKFLIPSVALHPKIQFHMPLAPCLGFGIVRGVDNLKHELYVTSPLSNDIIASVDCLATSPTIGSLPKPIILHSVKESKTEFVPYTMIKDSRNKLNRLAPRVFQPFLATPSMK